ncbi:MAG: hypothetical protein EBZ31_05745 [Flavobacteriia bacterium]|nr:hypothetical protein [Flavobacteriia bacterium]
MSPFTIVAQREFLSRVRKRTFLLMTLLGPLFFGALIFARIVSKNLTILLKASIFTSKKY